MEADDRAALIRSAVELFNAGDLDRAAELFHPMVEWPDLMDDKLIWGRAAVRDYWERQMAVAIPEVTITEIVHVAGDCVVTSVQRVLDRETRAELLKRTDIVQRFGFRDGLISRMAMFSSIDEASAWSPPD